MNLDIPRLKVICTNYTSMELRFGNRTTFMPIFGHKLHSKYTKLTIS